MKIMNEKFNLCDKNQLIEKFDVKPVRGIKGINETVDSIYVSKNGDILSFNRFRNLYYTYSYTSNDEIKCTDGFGYPIICIRGKDLDGNHLNRTLKLHRMIACTWIDNPNNLRDVDHIDCNKFNNCVDNLEWVTHAENCRRYWKNHVRNVDTNRLYIECCEDNMSVVQTINVDKYKIRYRKCKHCGRRVVTRQNAGENEFIIKNC